MKSKMGSICAEVYRALNHGGPAEAAKAEQRRMSIEASKIQHYIDSWARIDMFYLVYLLDAVAKGLIEQMSQEEKEVLEEMKRAASIWVVRMPGENADG